MANTTATSRSPQRRLFLALSGIAVATLLVVGVLLFQTRTTVVEIEALLERLDLTVEPPLAGHRAGSGMPAALARLDLLAPSLSLHRLDFHGAGRVEVFLAGAGPTTLRPGAGGFVRLTAGAEEPLRPALQLHGATHLSLEAVGRDRAGNRTLTLTLTGAEPWSAAVPTGSGFTLEQLGDTPPGLPLAAGTVPADSPDLTAVGGRGDSPLSLSLPPDTGRGTTLRLLDPASGEVRETHLPFALSEPRALPWRNQIVLLDPAAAAATPLLHPDLRISHPRFFRSERFEAESFVAGGKVRFPAGEREPLELELRTLLTLEAGQPLTLRSLTLANGRLTAVFWGRVTSLRLGPTPEFQTEELPSLFLWLYTQRLRALVYSTVASILGLCLGVIKLLGLFTHECSGKEKTP